MRNHAEWAAAIKRLSANSDKRAAARSLEELAAELDDSDDSSFTPWHFIQTLGLSAIYFEQAGDSNEAARVLEVCIETSRSQLIQAARAHSEVAGRLATLLLRMGSHEQGMKIGSEALRAIAFAPEPSLAIEQFLEAWRKQSAPPSNST